MLQKMTANFTGGVRYDKMEDRDYLVAPMVMLVEGVHEGNHGPLFYPADELSKIPQIWNHKPIVVYHPQINGELGVSACDPIILSNRKVGVIMNTTVGEVTVKINGKDMKLPAVKAEAWLEEDRMNKVDERIIEAIEKNQMMELSTGLFTDNETAEEGAEWNGEKYDAIARNYRPDHLALLPDLKGACSIEDGAGFLKLNARPGKINIVGNEMSHSNIRSLLNSWLQDKSEHAWIEAVYDDFFVYEDDGKYYKYNYSLENNQITITGSAEEVIRITEWRTLSGEFVGNKEKGDINSNKRKGQNMKEKDKKKIVDDLIKSNSNSWKEEEREILLGMEDAILEKLQDSNKTAEAAVENAVKVGAEEATKKMTTNQEKQEAEDKKTADEKKAKVEAVANEKAKENKKPKTTEEYIDEAPKEIRNAMKGMLATHKSIRASLIKLITDNERNQFTEDELQGKDLPELKKLVAILPGEKLSKSELEMNFEGLTEVEDITENKEEPLVMPAVVLA